MATPLGHSLSGLAIGVLADTGSGGLDWRWLLFAVVAANAADLDFLPGLVIGDANRFHQSASHSLVAAGLFGVFTALLARGRVARPWQTGAVAAILYASHLLLDFFTLDTRAPHGIPLLWPLLDTHFMAPVTLFGGVRHGVPGDGFAVVLREVFSAHNLKSLGIEIVSFLPLLALAVTLRLQRRRTCRSRI